MLVILGQQIRIINAAKLIRWHLSEQLLADFVTQAPLPHHNS